VTETSQATKIELIKAELEAIRIEREQLEKNLPAHGLKPGHLLRIEALESLIQEKEEELARIKRCEK